MARIKIEDLPKDMGIDTIDTDEMKAILGGLIRDKKYIWTYEIGGVEHTDTWSGEA